MYFQRQTYFTDDVPVSVTMEEEIPTNTRSSADRNNGHSTGTDSDSSVREQQAARLLQVTMATIDTHTHTHTDTPTHTHTQTQHEGREEIGGGITINTINTNDSSFAAVDANANPDADASDGVGTIFPGAAGSAANNSGAEDDYILQGPYAAATGDKSLEIQIERDLEDLSESERQQVYYDMRGEVFKAARTVSGSSSSVAADLTTMNGSVLYHQASNDASVSVTEIESLNRELFRLLEDPQEQQKNPVYKDIAKILSSSGSDFYANSIGFRTKLLRAELSDARKAARRTAGYLALLWESFGEKSLSRPIGLSDLSPTERQLQRRGYHQLFRFRDQSQYSRIQAHEQQQEQQSPEEQLQEHQLRDVDTGAGRRIAGSFDLCRCISTTEPAIDDAAAKVRIAVVICSVSSI